MTETLSAAPASGAGLQTVQLSIEKIYVKDLSLENPGSPQSFQLTKRRRSNQLRCRAVDRDIYGVPHHHCHRESRRQTLFLEVSQAGCSASAASRPNRHSRSLVHCLDGVVPVCAQAVADATMRAGFPPVQLALINFGVLY
jgi:preprotein translocase subunit SecB